MRSQKYKPHTDGKIRRFFWRANARVGSGWWKMTDREMRAYLRRVSHRRAL